MRSRRFASSLTAIAIAIAIPASAYAADKSGAEGHAKAIQVNSPSSDAYLQYHGRLFVTTGKTTSEYRWGGTSCGSRTMTPDMIQLLVDTVHDREAVKIVPTYQDGQGSTKCLVGFSIRNDKRKRKGNDDSR